MDCQLEKRKRRPLRSTSSTCSHQWKLSDLVPSLVPSCSRPRPTDRGLAALSLRECGERRNGVPLVTASPGTRPRWTSQDMAMDHWTTGPRGPAWVGRGGARATLSLAPLSLPLLLLASPPESCTHTSSKDVPRVPLLAPGGWTLAASPPSLNLPTAPLFEQVCRRASDAPRSPEIARRGPEIARDSAARPRDRPR